LKKPFTRPVFFILLEEIKIVSSIAKSGKKYMFTFPMQVNSGIRGLYVY